MTPNEWLQLARQQGDTALEQYRYLQKQRVADTWQNKPVNQSLADAADYLWARQWAEQGPLQAQTAWMLPPAYYGVKKLDQGLQWLGLPTFVTDERTSKPTLQQMGMGLLGALQGAGLFK